MGDIFIENLVQKRSTTLETVVKILIILAGCLVALPLLYLAFIGFFSGPMVLLAIGAIYGAYRLMSMYNVEFETCFTNGTFDVDKIINRRSRKRLISVNCKDVTAIGKYKAAEHTNKTYKAKIIACDSELSEDVWYITVNHSVLGNSLVVFNMTDKLTESFKAFIPRHIAFEAFEKRF